MNISVVPKRNYLSCSFIYFITSFEEINTSIPFYRLGMIFHIFFAEIQHPHFLPNTWQNSMEKLQMNTTYTIVFISLVHWLHYLFCQFVNSNITIVNKKKKKIKKKVSLIDRGKIYWINCIVGRGVRSPLLKFCSSPSKILHMLQPLN